MFNHAPENYKCPICLAIRGIESDATWIKQADIFFRNELVMGFISSKAINGNEGHPLIVPIKHIENIYNLQDVYGAAIFALSKKVARALKRTRSCDGVTLHQNNEPAGDQHALHYHLHIIPRFINDNFHEELYKAKKSDPRDRIQCAESLRVALGNQ